LSPYNGGILDTLTLRIVQLAALGLRLTNFNVENQYTPSRAALMTGRLPVRSGIGDELKVAALVLTAVGWRTPIDFLRQGAGSSHSFVQQPGSAALNIRCAMPAMEGYAQIATPGARMDALLPGGL
jgi:hypothetical protein